MRNASYTVARQRIVTRWTTLGTALAASVLFNRWFAVRAESEHPPIGDFIEIDGCRLHYLDRGAGRPVVMIHGSGSLIQDFTVSGIVDELATDHRVIVFDRPGYGYSGRPRGASWTPERQAHVMAEACDRLGIDQPLLVGHSWGTLPAHAWALDRPAAVRGLVLISGYYFATPRLDAIPTAIIGAPVVGDLIANTIAPLQSRLTGPAGLKMIFSPRNVPRRFLDAMPFGLMLRPGQLRATGADSGQMPIAARRLARRYGELTLPITIMWDDEDKLVGQREQSARLAKQLTHATALELPGTGHMLHHAASGQVAAAVRALT